MTKKVAIEKDVKATPGTVLFPPADKGSWSAGPVTETLCTIIGYKEKKCLLSATCIFTFNGTQTTPTGQVPITGSETVELKAKASALTQNGDPLLLEGDEAKGAHGNTLTVVASQQLLVSN